MARDWREIGARLARVGRGGEAGQHWRGRGVEIEESPPSLEDQSSDQSSDRMLVGGHVYLRRLCRQEAKLAGVGPRPLSEHSLRDTV